MVLATEEKALLAFEPTRRIVPTTNTKITASITAYSAMSCPLSSDQSWGRILICLQFLSTAKIWTLLEMHEMTVEPFTGKDYLGIVRSSSSEGCVSVVRGRSARTAPQLEL